MANCLLTAGGTPLNVLTELPTFAARGEKAKALAEEAARANKARFFITAMVDSLLLWDNESRVGKSGVKRRPR